jgi:CRP-like cAMP-binding protein
MSGSPLFRDLPPHFLTALQTVMERRTVRAGETIASGHGEALFLIERGVIAPRGTPPLRSGAWFGDLFTTSPLVALAQEDSVVLVLRYGRFSTFLNRHPGISIHMLAGLARELREATAGGARDAL